MSTNPPGDHDRRGSFAPGNNARAKVKARRTRGLARYIAENTRDGIEMADIMMEIARTPGDRDRFKAADWLVTRIMGKPADKVEVTGKGGEPLNPLAKVSIEDLLALAKAKTEGGNG